MKTNPTLRPFSKGSARSLFRSGLGTVVQSALVLAGSLLFASTGMAADPVITSGGTRTWTEDLGLSLTGTNSLWQFTDADDTGVELYEVTVKHLPSGTSAAPANALIINLEGSGAAIPNQQTGFTDANTTSGEVRFRATRAQINAALGGAASTLAITTVTNYYSRAGVHESSLAIYIDDVGDSFADPTNGVSSTITLTINAADDLPSFTRGNSVTVNEAYLSYGPTNWATAISPGGGSYPDDQPVSFTDIVLGNAAIFSTAPTINSAGQLSFATLDTDMNGSSTITAKITDGTFTSAASTSRTITITAVNDAPTLDPISDPLAILEDAGAQTVNLTGIGTGAANELQTLVVTATSNNTALIPNPTVTYTSPDATGSLSYTPVANANGTATITVTVDDNGGGTETIVRQFIVTVTAVNDAPTLTSIADRAAILEDAALQTVSLAGIGKGPANESAQTLAVTASSDNTDLIPNPTVVYTPSGTTGSITYTPVANAHGTANVTVTVTDSGGTDNGGVNTFSRTFLVTVTSVNDAPTLTTISNPTAILEDAGEQTINLSGITAGVTSGLGDESAQVLSVTATSSNTALIPNPIAVTYSSPDTTGSLKYTPVPNANGTADITVTVNDGGGGSETIVRTFTVTVTAVNDKPYFIPSALPLTNITVAEDSTTYDAGVAYINRAHPTTPGGIVHRGGTLDNESAQTITFTETHDAPVGFFTTEPSISGTTGNLSFNLAANANTADLPNGYVTISVVPVDNGGTTNGGVDTGDTVTFRLYVTPVNDVPSFTIPDTSITGIIEDSGLNTIAGFAATILKGGGAYPETSDNLTFNVSVTSGGALFSTAPAINSTTGDLTFTLAGDQNGVANLSITLSDDSGALNDTSAAQTASITVTAKNDKPYFTTALGNVTVAEDSTTYDAGLAYIDPDHPTLGGIVHRGGTLDNESAQTITFTETHDAPVGFFTTNPSISGTTGNLTFNIAANANTAALPNGYVTITVVPVDSGGTSNDGADTGDAVTFRLYVTPVNDTPSFTLGSDVTVNEDALNVDAPASFPNKATAILPGGGTYPETGDTLDFVLTPTAGTLFGVATTNTADLFDIAPDIDSGTGELTFQTKQYANGYMDFNVTLTDSLVNGTTVAQSIRITISPVNNAPVLTYLGPSAGAPVSSITVAEDSGAYGIPGRNSFINVDGTPPVAFVPGPAGSGESGQLVADWIVTNDNPALFSQQPDIGMVNLGVLFFTPAPNAHGTATVTVKVIDNGGTSGGGGNTSIGYDFTITVTPVNDRPVVTFATVNVNEDTGLQTIPNIEVSAVTEPTNPAGAIDGAVEGTTLTRGILTVTNPTHFVSGPSINWMTNTLTFEMVPNRFGTYTVTIPYTDNGLPPETRSATFNIVVNNVNDAPTFTKGPDIIVNEDALAYGPTDWATGMSDGLFESAQQTKFVITPGATSNPALFSVAPSVHSPSFVSASNGRLSFTVAPNQFGTATFNIYYQDNGGTNFGGTDTSPTETFTITVNPVNDAPSFTILGDQAVIEDSLPQTVPLFLTNATPGPVPAPVNGAPWDESDQTLTLTVSNTNTALFSTQPSINPATGTLTYAPAPNAKGTSEVTVTYSDDGGIANDGFDSTTQTFDILINVLPEISTVAANVVPTTATTDVRQARATLRAALTPEGVYAAAMFQYGTTFDLTGPDTLETPVSLTSSEPGDLPTSVPVSQVVTNLLPSTKYYYRAIATNQFGTVVAGNILDFTTLAPMWTWVGGSTGANNVGVPLGIGIDNASSTPPSRNGAGTWTSGGKHYVFGGVSPSAAGKKRNDLWEYNPSTSRWIWRAGSMTDDVFSTYGTPGVFTAGATPGARHTPMCWVHPTTGNLFLFGGFSPFGRCNDLWEYSVSLNQWKWIDTAGTAGLDEPGDYVDGGDGVYPGGRQGGATWTDPVTGEFWLFGGAAPSIPGNNNSLVVFNDLWMYNGSWNFIDGPTVAGDAPAYPPAHGDTGYPSARRNATTWVDRSGQFWLFGGQKQGTFSGTNYLNDLWKYDPGAGVWTWVKGSSTPDELTSVKGASGVLAAGNTPSSRSSSAAVSMPDGTLLMFGGISGTTTFYNEIWRWDWVTEQWAWISGSTGAGNYGTKGVGDLARTPGGRYTPSLFAGTNNETLWVFGGDGTSAAANGRLADLWRYDFAPLPQDKYDIDGDGMDDVWEITYFGNTTTVSDGALDHDSDSQSNAYEEVAGTNPNNAASLLTSTRTIVSGVPYMDYNIVKPNVTYQLSKSPFAPADVLSTAAFPTAGTGRVLDTTRTLLSPTTTQTAITDTAP